MVWVPALRGFFAGLIIGECGGLTPRGKIMSIVSMRDMLQAGVHFGHQTRFWNPKMGQYIFGSRNKVHVINLEHTVPAFNEALEVLRVEAAKGNQILFVGTKRAAQKIVKEQAERCGMPYVSHRWLGGMLTNWKTVCTRIERLKKLEQQEQDGIFDLLPKKEVASTRKELEKLRMHLNGIKDMPRTPDVMIVVDQRRELTAIKEAISLNIPVISILDTNCDPDIVDIPIPGNDDSIGSIKLLLNTLGSNILSGQNQNID